MSDLIRVGMADYKVGRSPSSLISYGLGSCIGIATVSYTHLDVYKRQLRTEFYSQK